MLLSSISLALTRLGQRLGRWSPLALWPNGVDSPGMWIDPSLLTASFNDYTGTTPVATPGSVADSANPVGLALDIRAGAPTTLGPELVVNGDFAAGSTGWTLETGWSVSGGQASISNAGNIYAIYQAGLTAGKTYLASVTVASVSAGGFNYYCGGNRFTEINLNSPGTYTAILTCGANGFLGVGASESGTTGSIDNISFKEIPGNHMLQATSAARPLESARVNLLQYTEDFGNAVWIAVSGGTIDSRAKTVTAPDGTPNDAWRLTMSGGAGKGFAYQFGGLYPEGTVRSGAIWMKIPSGTDTIEFNLQGTHDAGHLLCNLTTSWQEFIIEDEDVGGQFAYFICNGFAGTVLDVWHPRINSGSTALPYQPILTDGSSYSATGITPFQLYDGTDDGMATASFAAGTLSNAMDCMIAVRRDSAANAICGLYGQTINIYFGVAQSGSSSDTGATSGTPTIWVDNTQLTGGTAVTRDTLHTALTVGDWHILEFRDLDLSAWSCALFGCYGSGYNFNGARGDIMLYPSTASTADKDAARQYLADKYGVTLP